MNLLLSLQREQNIYAIDCIEMLTYVCRFRAVSGRTRCKARLAWPSSSACLYWGAGTGATGWGPSRPPPRAEGCCAAACSLSQCEPRATGPRWQWHTHYHQQIHQQLHIIFMCRSRRVTLGCVKVCILFWKAQIWKKGSNV